MKAEQVKQMSRAERVQMSNKLKPKNKGSHSHGGHSQADAGWTVNDTHSKSIGKTGEPSKSAALAPYRVQMPNGRIRSARPTHPISEDE